MPSSMIYTTAVAACLLACLAQPTHAATSQFGSFHSKQACNIEKGYQGSHNDCSCSRSSDGYQYYGHCVTKTLNQGRICPRGYAESAVPGRIQCEIITSGSGHSNRPSTTGSGHSNRPSTTQHLRGNSNSGSNGVHCTEGQHRSGSVCNGRGGKFVGDSVSTADRRWKTSSYPGMCFCH